MAARLRQARILRGFSQREVGVRMGLDKDTASARISRYESESMTVSLEALFELAQALDVPPAYLLATTPAMADAILALGIQRPSCLKPSKGSPRSLRGGGSKPLTAS